REMRMVEVEPVRSGQFERLAICGPDVGHEFRSRRVMAMSPYTPHPMHVDAIHGFAGGQAGHSRGHDVDCMSARNKRSSKRVRHIGAAAADRRIFIGHAQYFHLGRACEALERAVGLLTPSEPLPCYI